MVCILTDENFDNNVINAVQKKHVDQADTYRFEIVRIQDVGLMKADDPTILEWAAQHNCLVFTHDKATMIDFAYQRIREAQKMPGLIW